MLAAGGLALAGRILGSSVQRGPHNNMEVIEQEDLRVTFPSSHFHLYQSSDQVMHHRDYLAKYGANDVSVFRDKNQKVVYDQPNYGLKGFGSKMETSAGDVWEFDRLGNLNPLYIQARKASEERYVKPEHLKEWVGVNPDYDQGIDFNLVNGHFFVSGHAAPRGWCYDRKALTPKVVFTAPDTGVSGPQYRHPSANKMVYKHDDHGELNPLFVQIRRSMVRWE
jgi:hypothetical protein